MSEEENELARLKRNKKFYDEQLAIPAIKLYLGTAVFWMITVGIGVFFLTELNEASPINWSNLPKNLMVHFVGGFVFGLLLRWWYVSLNKKNNEKIEKLEQ